MNKRSAPLLPALLLLALLPIAACSKQDNAAPVTPASTDSTPAATAPTPAAPTDATAAAAPAQDPAVTAAAEAAVSAAAVAGPEPVAGTDYVEIAGGQPFIDDGKFEVVEIFGYTCPHCATFQPLVDAWKAKLPGDVRFTMVPAPFGGHWTPYAKAYYAAEALGVLEKSHDAVFRGLHLDRSLPVQDITPEAIGAFYAQYGVDAKQFASAMNSFAIDAKLNRAKQFIARSGVESTPTLVVNGKYRVTGRSPEDNLRIANQLIARERAGQAPAAQP